mgnify:CR=1 FL=1
MFYRAVSQGNHSSIGYCNLDTTFTVVYRMQTPLISPEFEYESKGLEDPRIIKIDDTFYLSYTCLLYTSDASDERSSVDLGGRSIITKKKKKQNRERE